MLTERTMASGSKADAQTSSTCSVPASPASSSSSVKPASKPTAVPLTSPSSPYILVAETRVYGLPIDPQTRCIHWSSALDIVALSHPCCGRFYPCAECHDAVAGHERTTWPMGTGERCVLCGVCGYTMTAGEYLSTGEQGGKKGCPRCGAGFNPRCGLHREKYFSA